MRALCTVLAVIGGCALGTTVAVELATGDVPGAVWALGGPGPYYAVGLFAVLRMPDRPVTAWLIAVGATFTLEVCLGNAVLPVLDQGSALWLVALVRAWLGTLGVVAGIGLIGLFPTGMTRRAGERWLLRALTAFAVSLPILQLLANPVAPKGMYPDKAQPTFASPLYLPPLRPAGPVADWLYVTMPMWVVAGAVLLYLRYRSSSPDERQRIRWLLFGLGGGAAASAAITVLAWVVGSARYDAAGALLWPVTVVLSLGALIIALSHEGVLGIDRATRRAVVYRALRVLITLGGVAVAGALGVLASRYVPIGMAVLLAAGVTLLSQPARRRLERLADRWVFGARLDSYEVLTDFGATLAASSGPDELLPRLAGAVRQGLGLGWARVRLNPAPTAFGKATVGADGIGPDEPAEPALVVLLVYAATEVGQIECGPRRDGLLLAEDRRLLEQLAGPAATAVHNLRLTAELSARLELIRQQATELTASRARMARAQDDERQRIQRDLHDGVQQDLVALSAKLALARERQRRGDPRANESLGELQRDLTGLLAQVREFAHAIHPPVLVDQGLLEAIEAQAARLPLEVVIEADPALRRVRYPRHIEAATWYLVSEALTNAVKHAQARRVLVALTQPDGRLAVEIRDDGCGFDPTAQRGLGLTGLADRIAIVNGSLRVDTSPGQGTTLHADIPLEAIGG